MSQMSQLRAVAPRRATLDARLRRYAPAVRPRVRALADRHPRLADLATSFPALLFALAVPRRRDVAELAIARVVDRSGLREVAATAGLPMWARHLPVDAVTQPLPALPAGELFSRRIVNHLPRGPKQVPDWLDTVAGAAHWIDEPFALWLARECAREPRALRRLPLVGLWAWFSQRPGTEAHRLIETPWLFEMGFKAARSAAAAWHERVELTVSLGDGRIDDVWLRPGPFDGYQFVPLDTAAAIAEEAAAMQNCLCTYGGYVTANDCRLWSVRKDGQRVATLSIDNRSRSPLLFIGELLAVRNQPAPVEAWWAATRWLHSHDLPAIRPAVPQPGSVPLDGLAWRRIWRPYWLAKRRIPPWLPLQPSMEVLDAL